MNQRQQLEQHLIGKAMKDETFRKQLIENPGAAIEAETGMKIPDMFKIKVLEEDPQTVYLILPQNPAQSTDMELSEEDLKSVTGGQDAVKFTPSGKPSHDPYAWI
jgi:hypothetical protein